MNRIFRFIVNKRIFIFIAFALLFGLSLFLLTRVKICYTFGKYLDSDTETKKALDITDKEFGEIGNIDLLFKDISVLEAEAIKEEITHMDGVLTVTFADEPSYYQENEAMIVVSFTDTDGFGYKLADVLEEKYPTAQFSGMTIDQKNLQETITREMPIILSVSILIVLLILMLTATSYLEPFIFLLVSLVCIAINLGTNIVFGEISYVTNSVSGILQLGLAMDYSIILLHQYHVERESYDNKEAMIRALKAVLKPISASALTTIFGLLALIFMSFKVGFDIGMVLMKGIVISALGVFTLLPGIIVSFSKLLDKTKKKRLISKGDRLAVFALKKPLLVVCLAGALVISCFALQLKKTFRFTENQSKINNTIEKKFGVSNQFLIVFPKTAEMDDMQLLMDQKLLEYNQEKIIVKKTISYANTISKKISVDEVASLLDIDSITVKELFTLYHVMEDEMREETIGFDDLLTFGLSLIDDPLLTEITNYDLTTVFSDLEKVQTFIKIGLETNEILAIVNSYFPKFNETIVTVLDYYREDKGLTEESIINGSDLMHYLNNAYQNEEDFIEELFGDKAFFISTINNYCEDIKYNNDCSFKSLALPLGIVKRALNINVSNAQLEAILGSLITYYFINNDHYCSSPIETNELVYFVSQGVVNNPIIASKISSEDKVFLSNLNDQLSDMESVFYGKRYARMIVDANLRHDTKETDDFIVYATKLTKEIFGDNAYFAGQSVVIYDVKESFDLDQKIITIVSIISIFLIVLLIFRSIAIPLLLVVTIQGAIWISLSFSVIMNNSIGFMAYIIATCILMGSTIDYGILISSNYVSFRRTMNKADAIKKAMLYGLPSIFTSGTILATAGFVVYFVSSQFSIYNVGLLIGRGALVSMGMVLLALPSVLVLSDRFIEKTTLKEKFDQIE